jgi:hypothetical protein
MWITNGPDADVLVVYAKTGASDAKPEHSISTFLIEKVTWITIFINFLRKFYLCLQKLALAFTVTLCS